MQKREGRSFVSPTTSPVRTDLGRTGRKRWTRPDVPRPVSPSSALLPTLDTAVPEVDPSDPMTRLDHLAMLPQAAQVDIVRGAL